MNYQEKVQALRQRHEALLQRKNQVVEGGNGIYEKYRMEYSFLGEWLKSNESLRGEQRKGGLSFPL